MNDGHGNGSASFLLPFPPTVQLDFSVRLRYNTDDFKLGGNLPATVQLTLDQVAAALRKLSPEERESLEELLNPKLVQTILRRSREAHQGKTRKLKNSG
jgi:hypothetical protein